jgi:hypothetical protein
MVIKWLSFILLMSASFAAHAQTINAASCSSTDVQAAFTSATSGTTTINIPAGTCHWSTAVTLTVPSGSANLSVLGAGSLTTLGGGDATVIIDDYASNNQLFVVTTGTATSHFRLAGITLQGGTGSPKYNGIFQIQGYSQNTRIDHSHFNTKTYSPGNNSPVVQSANWIEGVLDHNIFDGNVGGVTNAIRIFMAQYGSSSHNFGDGAWAAATGLGTSDFLFIENNTFNDSWANDCMYGGKFVLRYNTLNKVSVQTHTTSGGSDRNRGCRAFEVYKNTFTGSDSSALNTMFFLTGGTGTIWGNSAPAGYASFVDGYVDRVNNATYPENAPPNGWGYCGTAQTGSASNWDQNLNSGGYACIDQIGRGAGDLMQGYWPNACNVTSGGCAGSVFTGTWPHQALEPVYEWMDTWACVSCGGTFWSEQDSVTVSNRDYYKWCNASSPTGCASFTGAAGTGSGLLSSRPSTCTAKVAYWATDTNTLYQCSSPNTWTAYYTPYTYPHPLTTGSGTSPAPPTGLQAVVN